MLTPKPSAGIAYHMACGTEPELHFNEQTSTCDWPESAGCTEIEPTAPPLPPTALPTEKPQPPEPIPGWLFME